LAKQKFRQARLGVFSAVKTYISMSKLRKNIITQHDGIIATPAGRKLSRRQQGGNYRDASRAEIIAPPSRVTEMG
jgi:hypothetical protein